MRGVEEVNLVRDITSFRRSGRVKESLGEKRRVNLILLELEVNAGHRICAYGAGLENAVEQLHFARSIAATLLPGRPQVADVVHDVDSLHEEARLGRVVGRVVLVEPQVVEQRHDGEQELGRQLGRGVLERDRQPLNGPVEGLRVAQLQQEARQGSLL